MLLRMYTRWAQQRGLRRSSSTTAAKAPRPGISSATFIVKGRYAYGMLHGEKGVHRLIRISPFDANARRQTAFASLDAVPALDEEEAPEIDAEGSAHRHVPLVGRGRSARERHRLARCASRTCRPVSSCRVRTNARSCRTARRRCRSSPRGSRSVQRDERRKATRGDLGREARRRVRQSDPHVHARAVPTREGRAHPLRDRATCRPCSTATSTPSSRRICSGGANTERLAEPQRCSRVAYRLRLRRCSSGCYR